MTAPFELPDFMDVLTYPGETLLVESAPCRQVPTFMRPQYAFSGSAGHSVYTITHHVDFNYLEQMVDGSSQVDKSEFDLEPVRMLTIQIGDVILKLAVAWVEDRYSNTDGYYCRAYCWRLDRQLP